MKAAKKNNMVQEGVPTISYNTLENNDFVKAVVIRDNRKYEVNILTISREIFEKATYVNYPQFALMTKNN